MKKREPTAFEQYKSALLEAQEKMISDFFTKVGEHNALRSKRERRRICADFENALLYYSSAGVNIEDAVKRLAPENLGGFYARPPAAWYALDDAAKVYPLSMKHGTMAVFRLSVHLKKKVIPELLQMALTFTIKRFPSFATALKKGVFWHYLDASKRRYAVEEERDVPCRPLKISRSGSPSFRVLYYENRISVEYFHVLTDGAGGTVFLKTLVAEYLRLLGEGEFKGDGILDINEAPRISETSNDFSMADKTKNTSGFIDRPSLQLGGRLSDIKPCRILHFKMDAKRLVMVAREKNTTVTGYILALMFVAGKFATDEMKGNMNIQVPVNMRKEYPSDTLRNFSMYCGIKLDLEDIADADSIVGEISRQLSEKTSRQNMSEMMNGAKKLVASVRYVPLFIKAPVARIIYGFLGDKVFGNTLSNLGVVEFPEGLSKHIDSMDFVLATALTHRASCAMVTFGDTATLSISKMTADPSFEEKLFELLYNDGLAPDVEGSELYGY